MARFSSLQRLLSSTTATLYLRHYSAKPVDRQRHIWISGLVNPNKVGVRARKMLYAGKIDETHRIRFSKQEETQRHHYTQITALYGVSFLKWNVDNGSFGSSKTIRHYPKASEIYNGAAITSFNWKKDYQMNIIDTRSPCVDFPDDVRTALSAVDGAVLVLSSVVGVKKHSIIVDREMVSYKFPRLVFINKVDEKGADPWNVLDQTRSYLLKHHSAAIQVPIGLEDEFKGLVDLVQLKAYYFHDSSNGKMVVIEDVPANMEALVSEKRRELIKTVSEVDGKLAETFRSDKPISSANLEEAVRRATIAKKFIPVFMGSAYKYKGLQLLLDGVLNYLPCPIEASNYNFDLFMKPKYVLDLYTKMNPLDQSKNGEKHILVALAFTLKKSGHMTYLRIFEGVLRKGDFITDIDTGKKFEVSGLLGLYNDEVVLEAHAGEIIRVIHAGSDNFNLGLARYTTTSINVSKSFSRDSGVQAEFLPFGLYKPRDIRRVRNCIGWKK